MNPHFIFNALNTIQSYVYANDKKKAGIYLGKFSELIRKTLDNSNQQTISLQEEIDLLQLYIDIERERFGDSFQASFNIDPDLPLQDILVPPMLIQPYAENAIKHGLLHRSDTKILSISIHAQHEQTIRIEIDDNGIGRERSLELNKSRNGHMSFANKANEKRIDMWNQLSEKKIRLEIVDKKSGEGISLGTRVIIEIPYSIDQLISNNS
jgi:LytS/YehU family sensor histidine kinase